MRTVELLCGPALEAAVRSAWQRLADAGLPSLARHTHPSNRPHLTLASADDLPADAKESVTGALRAVLPLWVRLRGPCHFPGSGTLAWVVEPDPSLLALQRTVHGALHAAPGRNPLHEPDRWTPHLSLALRLPEADRGKALAALGASMPDGGELVAARSYDSATRGVTAF